MTRILCKFFELYVQDFDLVFEKATDPIDLFCQQNSRDTQRQLLIELNELRTQIFEGKKTLRHIIGKGLGYIPFDEQDPKSWLPLVINYLDKKINVKSNDDSSVNPANR